MTFHVNDIVSVEPVESHDSTLLFFLDQCRRFAAARDGLGSLPIDRIAADLKQNFSTGQDVWRLFGMLHELVRIIDQSRKGGFVWRPAGCRPSVEEFALISAFRQAREEQLPGLRLEAAQLAGPSNVPAIVHLLFELVHDMQPFARIDVPSRRTNQYTVGR
jgi:hypothetical protein